MEHKTYSLFDSDGIFAGFVPVPVVEGVSPPDNSTPIAPRLMEHRVAIWDAANNKWQYTDDYRGKIAYAKNLSGTLLIKTVGAIPDGFTLKAPPPRKQGFAIQWGEEDWEYIEDHRGHVGYVDGKQLTITEIGPLPKGWSTEAPPPPPDTRTPEEKRQATYEAEADPISQRIIGYHNEAEALRAEGDEAAAAECDAKAAALLKEFLAKKQEIRERYPDRGE